ncbi:hypothetical protein ACIQF6_25995 [Kitasatospora sp. NPDC092948]|uniref:hypothetical protein n=1 Tax=Kitasatospora sp. NPDC092948 TaxID=3364088 RepID=UPI003815E21E
MTTSATEPPSPEPPAAGRPNTPTPHVPRQPQSGPRRSAQPAEPPQDTQGTRDPQAGRTPKQPARRRPEALVPVAPEQVGTGWPAFLDRQLTLLREITRDTGDTVRFFGAVGGLVLLLGGAMAGAAFILHSMPLASAGTFGSGLLTWWGVARTARANRRRREQAERAVPTEQAERAAPTERAVRAEQQQDPGGDLDDRTPKGR